MSVTPPTSGVITAALFLEEFLEKRSVAGNSVGKHKSTPWLHIDFNGANVGGGRPGRPDGEEEKECKSILPPLADTLSLFPIGGEPQGMRALFTLIKEMADKDLWKTKWEEDEEEADESDD